jgi:hypothetical protein
MRGRDRRGAHSLSVYGGRPDELRRTVGRRAGRVRRRVAGGDRHRHPSGQRLEFTLDIGAFSEQAVIAQDAPLLQTDSAEIGDIIENREVVQLPLNGRNFLALAQLSDAVVMPPGGTRGEALRGHADASIRDPRVLGANRCFLTPGPANILRAASNVRRRTPCPS